MILDPQLFLFQARQFELIDNAVFGQGIDRVIESLVLAAHGQNARAQLVLIQELSVHSCTVSFLAETAVRILRRPEASVGTRRAEAGIIAPFGFQRNRRVPVYSEILAGR